MSGRFYSETENAEEEALNALRCYLTVLLLIAETNGNKTIRKKPIKIAAYGDAPHAIQRKIVSIDGIEIARVAYYNDTQSGNTGVEITATLDILPSVN